MRISLTGILILTTVVSALCLVFFVVPTPYDFFILGALNFATLPSVLLTGCMYSFGHLRTFYLGMTASVTLPLVVMFCFYIFAVLVEPHRSSTASCGIRSN